MATLQNNYDRDDDEDAMAEEARIEWSNLIFLPFHPVWKLIVLFSVLIKIMLGPIQSIYPIVYCSEVMEQNDYYAFIKYYYWYCCDITYGIDTFLHMVHRQVTDKARRREHLPKSAFLLLIDILSLIPFYRLVVTDLCPPVQLYPNILAFSEFFIIYRIVEYFSLATTHSFWDILTGYLLMIISCVNCVTCFLLLLTKNGLCENCQYGIYDWRTYIMHKLNETDEDFGTYVYGSSFVMTFVVNQSFDETKPSTVSEFLIITIMMVAGYLFTIVVVVPKLFAEAILRLRGICTFHPHVCILVEETKRRNSSSDAHVPVENFYKLMWSKRKGVTSIPEVIEELPRYLRVDLSQDLIWSFFYHSPTLRKTSTSFKRWICEYMHYDYKLPGEKFFAGPHCHTNLYYIKSGIVQLISDDDGSTPILSVSGGTIFGDVNFLVPPFKRKIPVKCLTYCEVYYLSRQELLRAIHKHPEDRLMIRRSVQSRIKHAKTLYACKKNIRGIDRADGEGIEWVKRRWWEISNAVANWKHKAKPKDQSSFDIPPEESAYHCAKYIGQLVLCNEMQLQTKSMFTSVEFPWILMPQSIFGKIWRRIVILTVIMVLLIYPPNIARKRRSSLFLLFKFWTDLIYVLDICVSLITPLEDIEHTSAKFATVMFARCKSLTFFLDVLATLWFEYLVVIIGKPEYFYFIQFNRLIKIYILFYGEFNEWTLNLKLIFNVSRKIALMQFSFLYIEAYFIYILMTFVPEITSNYFFGEVHCEVGIMKQKCDPASKGILNIAVGWLYQMLYCKYIPLTLYDIYVAIIVTVLNFCVYVYCKTHFVAVLYLKYRDLTDYQFFVFNLKQYYKNYKINQNLLKGLDRYLECHWKYYHGVNVMHPHLLKNEPYDIYWKVHGEVAERIISHSKAFVGADPALVRELVYKANFLILPRNSTLFLFGVQCKNVTWIAQGFIKCEYHDEDGNLLKVHSEPGQMISLSSVFLGKAALRTYIADTECEILYIKIQEFFKIIKRYPNEWMHFKSCIAEYGPISEKMFHDYVKKHKDYQTKLRDRVFRSRASPSIIDIPRELGSRSSPFEGYFWREPESKFMKIWMSFRALVVIVSIVSATLQGGSGAVIRWQLVMISAFCDCIGLIDIVLKIFLAYHDHRGLLITDKRMCLMHYLTRGFIIDIMGCVPWFEFFINRVDTYVEDDHVLMVSTVCKFGHVYILFGYFNYIADTPTVNIALIKIIKWQITLILILLGGSQYLMSHCVDFTFDKKMNLIDTSKRNSCWYPKFFELEDKITVPQLHMLYAESLNLAQCGFMGINYEGFHLIPEHLLVGVALFIMSILFWYVKCYTLTLLVLNSRGNNLFQHGVSQLRRFLTAERVDNKLINNAITHFRYWWMRTKGINIHHLTNERIGVVFRQDLNYFLYRKTFTALDTLIEGGPALERQLASSSTQAYYLPNEEIIREMDLIDWVFIVHRGKVVLSQNGKKLQVLQRGAIFGQLDGTIPRPVRVSAQAEGYVDLLQINIKQFQELISDEVRHNIAKNIQSANDFMAPKKYFPENPYDTVQYILRGRMSIKLPWMVQPMEVRHGNLYWYWLYLAWLIAPVVSTSLVLLINAIPRKEFVDMKWFLLLLDVVHFAHFIAGLYTTELVVVNNACVSRCIGLRHLKSWGFYIDLFSLCVPYFSILYKDPRYNIARLLRLRYLYYFHKHFCPGFKSNVAPIILNFVIVFLLLHTMTCGWIYVACRGQFPIEVEQMTPDINATIDYGQWVLPNFKNNGCARVTKSSMIGGQKIPHFVVPNNWKNDYVVAVTYIIIIYTSTNIESVIPVTLKQVYYKVVINFFLHLVDMWLMSVAISFIYTKYRELYQFDYDVNNLVNFLRHGGQTPSLLDSVREYTKELWKMQRGNWLPGLAQQAPVCLREDLLGALYMHHLESPPLFRQLPRYFTRQLVARLKRIVIFPGKCIVKEGDMFPCIYFIHEGEVEKWFIDKSGEFKMQSLLTTNGYFGFIPGLFPNTPFQFSYYTRTVVDLVFLRLKDWQDLLEGYPDVKEALYTAAKQLKREVKS